MRVQAALLFLHVRQSGSYSVEHALDVEVDHAVPLVDLQKRKRRDRHNAGIVDQDIDLSVCVDGLLDQSLNLRPICYVDRHGKRLCAIGLNALHNGVETILTSRSQNDCCAQLCQMASGTLTETAARTRD